MTRIAIVSEAFYWPRWPEFPRYTEAILREYCLRHDVDCLHYRERYAEGYHIAFDRAFRLLEAFEQGRYDFCIWMDADAAPLGMGVDLRAYLEHHPHPEKMQMVRDCNGWNDGVTIYPNNSTSLDILRKIRDRREQYANIRWRAQACLRDILRDDHPGYCIEADPDFGLNQYLPKVTERNPNLYRHGKHFCLHLANWPNATRDEVFRGYAEELHLL